MASGVDATFPADSVKVSKATMRAQMLIIKNELTEALRKVGIPWKIAIGDLSV